MSLFTLGDIKFNRGGSIRGPLASLVESAFMHTILRFPLDIGNYDKGHYMVFYIRQQNNTVYGKTPAEDASIHKNLKNTGPGGVVEKGHLVASISQASSLASKIQSAANKIKSGVGGIGGLSDTIKGKIGGVVDKAASGITGSINNLFGQRGNTFTPNAVESQNLIDNSIKRISQKSEKIIRTTTLTQDSIALYMPDTLQFAYTQSFDQLSLGNEFVGQVRAALKSATDAYKQKEAETGRGGAGAFGDSLRNSASESLRQLAGRGAGRILGSEQSMTAFLAESGRVVNPMLEMVYKSPSLRSFQFDFLFYPRDEREALEVQKILERFRFHQAPEVLRSDSGTSSSGFLIPPSEFDIRFYYAGAENPNIPQIATCILESININYAPSGFVTYEIPGENKPSLGRTGMPVAIQLQLQFKETTYLTKDDFNENPLVNKPPPHDKWSQVPPNFNFTQNSRP